MEREQRLPQNEAMTNIEANKKVVTEFIGGLFSRGDLSVVDSYLSDDFVNHDPPFGASADREGMRSAGAMFRAAFPSEWLRDGRVPPPTVRIFSEHYGH